MKTEMDTFTEPKKPPPKSNRPQPSLLEKVKMTQNLIVVSLGFMLVYSAFNAMQNLASSLLKKDHLGLISLSLVYGLAILTCFFGPWLMKRLTPKWTILTAYTTLVLFLLSMFHPRLYTVVPSSILWGAASGPLWTAASLYITTAGLEYGVSVQGSVPWYLSQFNAIWMMFVQISQIIGNTISALVLEPEVGMKFVNQSCGANYDHKIIHLTNFSTNMSINSTSDGGPGQSFHLLGGIYTGMVVTAIILTLALLRPFKHYELDVEYNYGSIISTVSGLAGDRENGTIQLLTSIFTLMRNPKMYLMIPMCYLAGCHIVFLVADFTKAYTSCGLGVNYIGFTMLAFGVSNSLGCYLIGRLYQVVGRVAIFVTAFALNIGLYVSLLLWEPQQDQVVVYFLVTAVYGLVDAVFQPQTMAFLGYLFPTQQETTFSNYNLIRYIGMTVTYAYSGHLAIPTKIYLQLAISLVTVVSYTAVECRISRRRRKRRKSAASFHGKVEQEELQPINETNNRTIDNGAV